MVKDSPTFAVSLYADEKEELVILSKELYMPIVPGIVHVEFYMVKLAKALPVPWTIASSDSLAENI